MRSGLNRDEVVRKTLLESAPDEKREILEQMVGQERKAVSTPIGKKHSFQLGLVFIVLGLLVLTIGFFLKPALPLLVAGCIVLILMGSYKISNARKSPCVCPYCGNFDDIADDITTYCCSRCGKTSRRQNNHLSPIFDPVEIEH